MSDNNTKATTTAFVGGYLISYFGSLWIIITLLSNRITASWIFLGSDAWKVRLISIIAPVIAVLIGMFTASVTLMAAEARGSDRMRPWRFFKTGWISMVLANAIIHCTAFKVFIPVKEGELWLQHIDQVTYNGCVFLLSPTVGFIGASFAVVLTKMIIEAQKG